MTRMSGCLVAVVSLLAPGLAAAQNHATIERQIYGPFDVTQQVVVGCDGFDVLTDYEFLYKMTSHYDVSGQIVKIELKLDVVGGRYYNSVNPQHSVLGLPAEHEQQQFAFVDGEAVSQLLRGPSYMVRVPGYGVIFAETGMFRFDITTGELLTNTGWNQFMEQDGAALCSYLR